MEKRKKVQKNKKLTGTDKTLLFVIIIAFAIGGITYFVSLKRQKSLMESDSVVFSSANIKDQSPYCKLAMADMLANQGHYSEAAELYKDFINSNPDGDLAKEAQKKLDIISSMKDKAKPNK